VNTVVVGAVDGYTWNQCELWWKSLKITGFKGEITLLAYNLNDKTYAEMIKRNINVIKREPGKHAQVVVNRFQDYAWFANTFSEDTWIVCTDVSDIAFQKNPEEFLWTEDGVDQEIVVASEGIFFKGNRWVRENLFSSFPSQYDRMENEILYNAGSFAARSGVLTKLALEVFAMCMKVPEARNHDQAAFNILLRDPHYGKRTLFTNSNDEWCFCGASSIFAKPEDANNYMEELPMIEDGLCYVLGHRLTTMFHHYSRDPNIAREVRKRILGT
jgi:hypothetical protein